MNGPKTFTGETTDAKAMREAFEAMREALREVSEQVRFTAPWGSEAIVLTGEVERRCNRALALADKVTK